MMLEPVTDVVIRSAGLRVRELRQRFVHWALCLPRRSWPSHQATELEMHEYESLLTHKY